MKKITCGIIAMLSVVTLHSQDSGSELYTTEVDKKMTESVPIAIRARKSIAIF